MIVFARKPKAHTGQPVHQQAPIVDFLRAMVINGPNAVERFHAVFLGQGQAVLGHAPVGQTREGTVSLRMRELFGQALSYEANSLVVAHNHPSGSCRPSRGDIAATHRLKDIARALDIELLDHLIFTQSSVYSMRAGGEL